jgi:hypothetical protein
MPIVDTLSLDAGEPLPRWHDRYFHSETMSFTYYDVDRGASIHEHWHDHEEIWHVIEGTLEFTIDSETLVAGKGCQTSCLRRLAGGANSAALMFYFRRFC